MLEWQAMGSFTSATAIHGRVEVHDYNGNTTEVPREKVRVLMEACITALSQPEGCVCGARRVEVVSHPNDEAFFPPTGCSTCNTWDGPPVLRHP